MKRFWKNAEVVACDDGWGVELDGRLVRTPARVPLNLRQEPLARAIADEWQQAGETVDPRSMPLTGLANAAIDRIAPDPQRFATDLARYAEADLLSYRADGPQELINRQAAAWDPLLQWARRRYDVDFAVTHGITHVAQPPATIARLSHAVAALGPFHLAGLSPLVTIGGSLVAALAVLEGEADPDFAWAALTVDDAWQLEKWGSDAEAEAALANRRADFMAAASFLSLL
jgi:chaperone required for assembly of F1-ATPase